MGILTNLWYQHNSILYMKEIMINLNHISGKQNIEAWLYKLHMPQNLVSKRNIISQ